MRTHFGFFKTYGRKTLNLRDYFLRLLELALPVLS